MNLTLSVLVLALLAMPSGAQDSDSSTKRMLDPARQRAVWDSEHVTFKIERRFGPWFLDALRQRDPQLLEAAFHEEFSGSVLDGSAAQEERSKGEIEELRRTAGARVVGVGADGVIAGLLAHLEELADIEGLGLRVLQISAGGEGRWDARVLLTASGRGSAKQLVALDSEHSVAFRIRSVEDFHAGAVISSWRVLTERKRAAPRKLMEEVTEASQLHRLPLADNWTLPEAETVQRYSFQFAVEDFDRDGYLDIAIASVRGPTALLKSLGGKQFAIANQAFGIPRMATRAERALACWLDFDNDGFPDLILGDRVYRNLAGKRFEEITAQCGIEFPQSPMGCAVADYDGDGLCDLYLLYQGAGGLGEALPWVGDDISGEPNALWRNLGGGKFENVSGPSNTGAGKRNSFAATWLYADGDALPDLYVANDFGANNLLRNLGGGRFEDIAAASGVADFATSMGVASGDLDNDGSPEIYVANMYSKMGRRIIAQVSDQDYAPGVYAQIKGACAGNRLYKRSRDGGPFTESSEGLGINNIGWAYAPAFVDLDNDGLLDLHACTGFLSFDRRKPDG